MKNGKVYLLDLAAKLDETANFLCADKWKTRSGSAVEFPAPFGRDLTKEVGVTWFSPNFCDSKTHVLSDFRRNTLLS